MMKAVWLENKTLTLRGDVPVPEPATGQALVRVRWAGICATDLEMVRGYSPFRGIPGHEFVGEIVAAPDQPERSGERVVGEINIPCGSCYACMTGLAKHCERRAVLGIRDWDGALAEYVCLPLKNLITVPAGVADREAVFAEPLAAALAVRERVTITPDDRVLVLGAGCLGQLLVQALVLTGCDLHAAARYARQRELLQRSHVTILDADQVPERCFDMVIDATGSPSGFEQACRAARPRGTLVLKSTVASACPVNLATLVVNEITVVGSRCGPMGKALQLIANKMVLPEVLIDACLPLSRGLEAFARAAEPGALKILVRTQA